MLSQKYQPTPFGSFWACYKVSDYGRQGMVDGVHLLKCLKMRDKGWVASVLNFSDKLRAT